MLFSTIGISNNNVIIPRSLWDYGFYGHVSAVQINVTVRLKVSINT